MAAILLPQQWTRQPQIPVGVAPAYVPRFFWAQNNGPSTSGRIVLPLGTSVPGAVTVSPAGVGIKHNGSTQYENYPFATIDSATPVLLGGYFVVTDASTANQSAVGIGDGANSSGGIFGSVGQTSGTSIDSQIRTQGGGGVITITGPTAVLGQAYAVYRIQRAGDSVMFVNGIKYTGAGVTSGGDVYGNFTIGGMIRLTSLLQPGAQNVLFGFADFGVDPGDAWAQNWSAKPWSIFAPLPRRIFVSTAAGGSAGTATVVFGATGATSSLNAQAGSSAVVFGATAASQALSESTGTSTVVFGATGGGASTTSGQSTGTAAFVFDATGTSTSLNAAAGSSTVIFGASGANSTSGTVSATGTASFTFNASSIVTSDLLTVALRDFHSTNLSLQLI